MVTLPAVKRLLLILMLLFIPLQATWSAASAYCGHEQGAKAQHLGHHEHDHHQAQPDDDSDEAPLTQLDPDCAYCHIGSFAIFTSIGVMAPDDAATVTGSGQIYRLQSSLPERPERPKWEPAV
jgi:hypothetical protein